MKPELEILSFEEGFIKIAEQFATEEMTLVAIAFGPEDMTPVAVGFVLEDKFFEKAMARAVHLNLNNPGVFNQEIHGIGFCYLGSVVDEDGALLGRMADYIVFPEFHDQWDYTAGRIFLSEDESVFVHEDLSDVEDWPTWRSP